MLVWGIVIMCRNGLTWLATARTRVSGMGGSKDIFCRSLDMCLCTFCVGYLGRKCAAVDSVISTPKKDSSLDITIRTKP